VRATGVVKVGKSGPARQGGKRRGDGIEGVG
jgi:hypothetical protein